MLYRKGRFTAKSKSGTGEEAKEEGKGDRHEISGKRNSLLLAWWRQIQAWTLAYNPA
jgi:hypothetical protein